MGDKQKAGILCSSCCFGVRNWFHFVVASSALSVCCALCAVQVHELIHNRPGFMWSLLVNSCIAYLVNLTNFLVTKYTSALTLQVNIITNKSCVVLAMACQPRTAHDSWSPCTPARSHCGEHLMLYAMLKHRLGM
jgi:hypothetical protein